MNRKLLTVTLTAVATLATVKLIRKGIRKLSENPRNPRNQYTKGDYVKIPGLPTPYRIDRVDEFGGLYVYHLEGTPETSLYAEDALEPVDYGNDFDDLTDNADTETIVPIFNVGDRVQIDGSPETYDIIVRYAEMIYGLQNVETSEYIELDEYALKPFDDHEIKTERKSVEMTNERKLTPRELSNQEAEQRKAARKKKAEDIDTLLEIAFWNRKQYEKTGDADFAEKERETYEKIEKLQAE